MSDLVRSLGTIIASQAELIRQLTKELAELQDILLFQKDEVVRLQSDLAEARRENTDLRNQHAKASKQVQNILMDNLVFFVRKHPDFRLHEKIRQIKIVRGFTGMNLSEAKEYVENHAEELNNDGDPRTWDMSDGGDEPEDEK